MRRYIPEQEPRQRRLGVVDRALRIEPSPGLDQGFIRFQDRSLLIQQHRPTRPLHSPGRRFQRPMDQSQQGRLAGPVRPCDRDPFRPRQPQADRPHHSAPLRRLPGRIVQNQQGPP